MATCAYTSPPGRYSSSYAHLNAELTSRRLPLIFDYLNPQNSHLLDVSLADYLPQGSPKPSHYLPPASEANLLPFGHHLIYFPPPKTGSQLLPDGTDPDQSPGEPFVRRMWAGGHVRYNPDRTLQVRLDGKPHVCVEGIRDVSVKGKEGDEKVFVGIERRVGRIEEAELAQLNSAHRSNSADAAMQAAEDAIRARVWTAEPAEFGAAGTVERRNIVFMRERPPADAAADAAKKPAKMLKAQHAPDFEHTLAPNDKLLFRYSALTFNAHAIHLDPAYCRDVEGHRNLLVHGPLSFTLMTTLLRLQLAKEGGQALVLREVEYRNLAPLYAGEPLRLCGRLVGEREGERRYEVWAETPEGGIAVKGTARVGSK
ncbi:hypothetical protein LTR04_003935 [Oleoguttula sp. CCFEE 6159]|nr:hypothetical protein LTR04_003935 [Oleoguttula sp. CCFEE 6159]